MYARNDMGVNRNMAGSSDGNYFNKFGGYILRQYGYTKGKQNNCNEVAG